LPQPRRQIADAHERQQRRRPVERRLARDTGVPAQDLRQLLADAEDGIERGGRVLEDHRHPPPADLRQPLVGLLQQVFALEQHAAGHDARRRRCQAQQRQAGDGLATAGFTDDAQRLPGGFLEIDAIDRPHHAVARVEMHF
jgi:hypothetical protein